MANEHDRVIAALEATPEKTLLIVELTRELVGADGQIDHDRAAQRAPDVNLAVAEAEAYTRATARAIDALCQLPARSEA